MSREPHPVWTGVWRISPQAGCSCANWRQLPLVLRGAWSAELSRRWRWWRASRRNEVALHRHRRWNKRIIRREERGVAHKLAMELQCGSIQRRKGRYGWWVCSKFVLREHLEWRALAPHCHLLLLKRLLVTLHVKRWHIYDLLLSLWPFDSELQRVLRQEVLQPTVGLLEKAPRLWRQGYTQHAQQQLPSFNPCHVQAQFFHQSVLVYLLLG
mmetsp:Transcript_35373/g.64760  ORF Transcript_35373/g.64760 Transcript_35373/m.64760 type:complete len:212 (-) Transcript_35373:956-1591(-)